MIGFSKALAYEGARSGVTVNVIAPGYTSTPMVEQMKPEILSSILSTGKLEEDTEKMLIEVITQLKQNFKS